ncbi:MAG: 4-hydroxy-3-methylbut-2-enyl diphosphate reductase [bacterium]|nr:4-hydroxy-3-methylbut-2-enyl diphosphate reductase [bacterium]
MNIILAKHAGLCFGVRRAISMAKKHAKSVDDKTYTIGPLIHNPQTVELLQEKCDIHPAEELTEIKDESSVVVRSHGIPKQMLKDIKLKGLDVVDATCPFVQQAQSIVEKLAADNKPTLIIGDENHPEVVGIKSYAKDDVWIANSVAEINFKNIIADISHGKVINIVCQTTQSFFKFEEIVSYLNDNSVETNIFNTICDATMNRQKEAIGIARKVDLMIIIGGRNSSNTKKLLDICHDVNENTIHIEEEFELAENILKNVRNIGVATGASTPSWIIRRVITKIRRLSKDD